MDIGHELRENAGAVVDRWEQTANAEPWLLLPERDRTDHLPTLTRRIGDAVAASVPRREALLALAHTAVEHGEQRREQGLPDSIVLTEYYLLRQAIWDVLRERSGRRDTAILRVDVAISLATRASLLGFHRPQLERVGRWEGALDRLVAESPLAWNGVSR